MSWNLIKSIQKDTDLRLILPFGLNLRLGDVISVGKDGNFTLEGTCASLLRLQPGKPRTGGADGGVDLMRQSGKKTTCKFRAAGTASSLFPELPSASAGFDIAFGSQDGWILGLTGRSLASLNEVDRFRRPILDAYRSEVWKPDWALVTSVATVKRMTLLASRTRDTNVALSLSGKFVPDAPLELKLTAGASLVATSHQIIQCVTTQPMPAFCSAIRVRDRWWSRASIGTLGKKGVPPDARTARHEDFWEDADDLGR